MKKKNYESPLTKYVEVELEGCLCGSVYEGGIKNAEGVTIKEHSFGVTGDYTGSSWDGEENITNGGF